MPLETALEAIREHLQGAGARGVSVGFIGGEPLLNRAVLHQSVRYAAAEAARRGVRITFGITTNGVVLSPEDIDLFRSHPFAVTISLDGTRESHDAMRKTKSGRPSYEETQARVAPLLANPGAAGVAARVTLTRRNLDVPGCIDALAASGFTEIGVSPLRTGPDPSLCLSGGDWLALLEGMKVAAIREWDRVKHTRSAMRFSNFSTALRQLYRGAFQALPCGSGADYVSLSADGRYFTSHRTVGQDSYAVGDLSAGPSFEKRLRFISARHVDLQQPCSTCWARYLCGGGCHHEVLESGRFGCDFIRGWLEFCMSLYPQVLSRRPDLLQTATLTMRRPK
jgi:uncharacterized protein